MADRTVSDEQRSEWTSALAAINYAFDTEPKNQPDEEIYGFEVTGLVGTDRQGERFNYRFQENEDTEHLMKRVLWERSWDGYEPLADYLARNPMP